MLARLCYAVVNIDVTLTTCESLRTAASILIDEVTAHSIVVTGMGGTLIHVFFTVLSGVS